MKNKITLITLFFILITFSSCVSEERAENSTVNETSAIPYSTLSEINDYLEAAIPDDTANVYVFEDDCKLSVYVNFNMVGMNYLYAYRLKQITDALSALDFPVGEAVIQGLTYRNAELYETTEWRTSDLKHGMFNVVSPDIDKFIYEEKTIDEIYDYCGFKSSNDELENETTQTPEIVADESKQTENAETTVETEQIRGATIHSRAGSQYYTYGVLPYGATVEIIGYTANGEWINFMFEGKNAYFESKYFQSLNFNTGMIIDPNY